MAKETKIGLALILVLLGAFSFVAYKKMNEHNETLKEIAKTEKSEDDDDDSLESLIRQGKKIVEARKGERLNKESKECLQKRPANGASQENEHDRDGVRQL